MQRTYSGSFPAGKGNYNIPLNVTVADVPANSSSQVGWTPGAYIVVPLPIQPPSLTRWKVLTLAVAGQLSYGLKLGFPQLHFGKLGKIVAGISVFGGVSQPNYTDPTVGPWTAGLNPPTDPTLVAPLWDGETDAMPPTNIAYYTDTLYSITAYQPVACVVQPPNPVPLTAGAQVNIGIWMYPSLVGNTTGPPVAALTLCNATFTAIYDDGT